MNLQHSEMTSSASMENRTTQDDSSAQYFALIAIDRYGKIHRQVAPSIIHSRDVILNPHVTAEFLKAVANSTEGRRKPSPESACTQPYPRLPVSYDSYSSFFPEEFKPEGHVAPATNGYYENPTLWPGPGIARSPILKDDLLHKHKTFPQGHRMKPQEAIIFIKDSQFLRRYYEKVFQNLQQTNCRMLAKVYVRLVEPHKQVNHPYNGRKVVAGGKLELSPEESKPPWWPPEVRHREPDHLLKAGKRKFYCAS